MILRRWLRQHCGSGRKYKKDALQQEDPLVPVRDAETSVTAAALRLAALFFGVKETRRKAAGLSFAVALALLAESGAGMYYSSVQKDFMTALQAKDLNGFYAGLFKTARLILFICPITGLHHYTAGILKMSWRAALAQRFAHAYLAGDYPGQSTFYRLTLTGDIDNPDQRICQDVNDFVDNMFHLVQDFTGTLMSVVGFSVVLYNISPTVCMGIFLYALVGTLAATLGFGPWIMQYQSDMVKQEAGLRYTLIRTRENAESIAFFRGGSAEWLRFRGMFSELLATTHQYIVAQTGMTTFNRGFHWATFAVPGLLVGPRYVRGEVDFGTIAQTGMAFNTILGGLTLIMNRLETLTGFAVRVRRLHALDQALRREEGRAREAALVPGRGGTIASRSPSVDSTALCLRTLTVRTPARQGAIQHTLVDQLSLQVSCGQSVLIAGQSGIGKSSLLRAVAGLWTDGGGHIELLRDRAYFMPQRPYMFLGSLREQLLYPQVDKWSTSDAELEDALRQVNLGYLLLQHSMRDTKEWASLLSLGEQQRINFARVLLQPNVSVALIDEGTSACDPANEAHLYGLLQQRLQSYISIGHRPALRQYHTHALWLQRSPGPREPAMCSFHVMAEFEKASWAEGHG